MKDGRTHLAHKAEHAVDLETGAIVAVTLQEADLGDTTTIQTTLPKRSNSWKPWPRSLTTSEEGEELVDDKGYHSKQTYSIYSPWDYAPISVNRIAVGSTGSISRRSATPCMQSAAHSG